MKKYTTIPRLIGLAAMVLLVAACSRDPRDPGIEYSPEMYVSIPYEPFTQVEDSFAPFKNKMNQQLPPEGTIQRGGHGDYEYANLPLDSGKAKSVSLENPVPYSTAVYDEGKVLYERFCGVCHGKKGKGDGKVSEHEAINPSAYDAAGIKELTGGQLYHTIMMGKGVMGSYASQLSYEDRWKVVHYVQTLQDEANKAKKEMEAGLASEESGDAGMEGNEDGGEEMNGETPEGEEDHGDDHSEEAPADEEHGEEEH